jgi:negative regulator of sigma E activity
VTLRRLPWLLLLVPVLATASPATPPPAKGSGWLGQTEAWIGRLWNRRDASDWLDQIGKALREQNYQGTLVMVSGGRMETLSIYHSFANGVERERLVTLSGQRRELVRNDQRVVLLGAEPSTAVAFDANPGGRWNPAERFAKAAKLEGYRARLGRTERVAGHYAQVVELRARDPWRYGYRLWLEKESGLPLRMALLDGDGRTLEQVAFTAIELGKVPAEADLRASNRNALQRVQTLDGSIPGDPLWQVVDPPPGAGRNRGADRHAQRRGQRAGDLARRAARGGDRQGAGGHRGPLRAQRAAGPRQGRRLTARNFSHPIFFERPAIRKPLSALPDATHAQRYQHA